ncbi:MAG: hypothetical protein IT371_23975 [Deltaproteobacteria bacterium]|nr:hypothetical protein [Deltaproteobacteria bacterium]
MSAHRRILFSLTALLGLALAAPAQAADPHPLEFWNNGGAYGGAQWQIRGRNERPTYHGGERKRTFTDRRGQVTGSGSTSYTGIAGQVDGHDIVNLAAYKYRMLEGRIREGFEFLDSGFELVFKRTPGASPEAVRTEIRNRRLPEYGKLRVPDMASAFELANAFLTAGGNAEAFYATFGPSKRVVRGLLAERVQQLFAGEGVEERIFDGRVKVSKATQYVDRRELRFEVILGGDWQSRVNPDGSRAKSKLVGGRRIKGHATLRKGAEGWALGDVKVAADQLAQLPRPASDALK